MKRLFTLFAMLFAGLTLTANENTLKTLIGDYTKAQFDYNGTKAISYLHKNYQYRGVAIEKMNYAEVQKLCRIMDLVRKICSPNWQVSDYLELNAVFQNHQLTTEERAQHKAADKDPELRKQIEQLRVNTLKNFTEHRALLQKSAQSQKIVSVEIKGNNATVIFTYKDIDNTDKQDIIELVKENDKWLIIKETVKLIKP